MDSYRVEKKTAAKIQLPDSDAEIEPSPTIGGAHKPEPEFDRLSNILKVFHALAATAKIARNPQGPDHYSASPK